MKPTKRMNVNKRRSASNFRHKVGKTRAANIMPPIARGGIRL